MFLVILAEILPDAGCDMLNNVGKTEGVDQVFGL